LKVQGQSSVIAIDDLEELRLTPSQRNVTFQFAALDYVDSKEIRYAYRLKGLEEEWHDGDKNRSASYINLPNGKYKLQIHQQRRRMDGQYPHFIHQRTAHFLGDGLGMAALRYSLRSLYGQYRICTFLYLSVAPPSGYRATTIQYQAPFLY
jgi:hypothetical protein